MKIACLVYELYTYIIEVYAPRSTLETFHDVNALVYMDLNEWGTYFILGLFAEDFALCV